MNSWHGNRQVVVSSWPQQIPALTSQRSIQQPAAAAVIPDTLATQAVTDNWRRSIVLGGEDLDQAPPAVVPLVCAYSWLSHVISQHGNIGKRFLLTLASISYHLG